MTTEGAGLSRGFLQERCLLQWSGIRDRVVLKRRCGLHQKTRRDEVEWQLVMSPGERGRQDSGSVIKTINHGDSHGEV